MSKNTNILEVLKRNFGKTSIKTDSSSITYDELYQHTKKIASYISNEIKSDVVAVFMDKGTEHIYSVLGLYCACKTYLPLSSLMPKTRIEYIVNDSKVEAILTSKKTNAEMLLFLESIGVELYFIEDILNDRNKYELSINQNHNAYIIYTSGSTGNPKGILMSKFAISNLLEWQAKRIGTSERVLQFSSIIFDVSYQEILSTLLAGAIICTCEESVLSNLDLLLDYIITHEVERIFLPYAGLRMIAQYCVQNEIYPNRLRNIITAGEQVKVDTTLRKFFKNLHGCALENQYGPAETHVVTSYTLDGDVSEWPILPPIGKPLPFVRYSVASADENDVGELVIEGNCLANGYLNLPEKTNLSFKDNKYVTGDLVKVDQDGLLHFIGRNDTQIKLNGYRIETSEIECVTQQLPYIDTAIVVAVKSEDFDSLILFVTTNINVSEDFTSEIKRHLKEFLPAYMLPSVVIGIDGFKKTISGKIDMLHLQNVAKEYLASDYSFDSVELKLEERILSICKNILLLKNISVGDNFFDLGGTSLHVLKLKKDLEKYLKRKVNISDIYRSKDIAGIAKVLSEDILEESEDLSLGQVHSEVDDVAIVGISCKLPGVSTPEEFWELLCSNSTSITSIKESDLECDFEYMGDDNYILTTSILEDADSFDHQFWGVSQSDSSYLDAQIKKLLECTWHAFEDAKINPYTCPDTSVYTSVGLSSQTDSESHCLNNIESFKKSMGQEKDYSATHISHKFNFQGRSVNIQSACSSALVALDAACRDLTGHESTVSVVGSAFIRMPQKRGYLFQEGMVFSKDGVCRPFDNEASGTVFGNGAVVFILKRKKDAIKDGNYIYGLIKGTAVNNDGGEKSGFSSPSSLGQSRVFRKAVTKSEIDINELSYIETHGTGTLVGDPIEVDGIVHALQKLDFKKSNSLKIGSVKSNIGHLGYASGLFSVLKVVLGMNNKSIPATINYNKLNSNINFDDYKISVCNENWPWDGERLIAGVAAFGLGGTNAYAIVENYTSNSINPPSGNKYELILSSAKSKKSLNSNVSKTIDVVNKQKHLVNCMSRQSALHRNHFEYRHVTKVDTLNNQIKEIIASDEKYTSVSNCFLFPGQGVQYEKMGIELYESSVVFKKVMDEIDEITKLNHNFSIIDILYNESDKGLINDIEYTQVCLVAIEVSLAELLIHIGIQPDTVLGHSTGEYAAAYVAGVFSLEDAINLSYLRSLLMKSKVSNNGAMLLVFDNYKNVENNLKNWPGIDISVINSDSVTIVSGKREDVDSYYAWLKGNRTKCKYIKVDRPGHCRLLNPIIDDFNHILKDIEIQNPKINYISCFDSKLDVSTPSYWVMHTLSMVDFPTAMVEAANAGTTHYIECGPQSTLIKFGQMKVNNDKLRWFELLNNNRGGEQDSFTDFIASYFCSNGEIDWTNYYLGYDDCKNTLPLYSFEYVSQYEKSSSYLPHCTYSWSKYIPVKKSNDTSLVDIYISGFDSFESSNKGVVVNPSQKFKKVSDDLYEVDFNCKESWIQFFSCFKNKEIRIIYNFESYNDDVFDYKEDYSFIVLFQAICQVHLDLSSFVFVVSNKFNAFGGEDNFNLTSSLKLGVIKSLNLELSFVDFIVLDVDKRNGIGHVVNKYDFQPGFYTIRDDNVLVQKISTSVSPINVSIRNTDTQKLDGVAIIFGGLGGIGQFTAAWMISHGVDKVILVSRDITRTIYNDTLLKQRDKFEVHKCDICNSSDVDDLISFISSRYDVKYIVNSTCLIKDALVSNVIFDDWEKVISSKVKGSKNILSSIKLNKLNDVHLINYSSLTSFIGNVGQTAYAAANYFLDDLSLYLKNQGVCTTTINWGPISDIGDLSTNEVAKKAVVDLGMKLITSQEIKDTLSYCLYDKPNKITLAPVEWDKFISVNNLGNNTLFLSMSVEKTNGSNTNNIQNSFSQDWSLLNVKDRLDNVKNIITDLVQNRLKSNNINVTQNLKDYGLDSLSGILLKNQIEKLFEIKLPVQFCFDFSSIESMVLEVKKLTKVQSDISNNSDKVDISFQQKRWLNLLNKGYGKLVVPIVFNTELNDELFYKALSLVIHKHDILRCVFSYNEAKLLSISDVIKQMKRTFYDLKLLNDREKRLSEIYNSVIDGYNDISVMTPYQLHLVDYKKDQFVILLALQHLVFDGTSVSIFINDLRNAYSDLMLGTSKFNYSTTQYSSYIDEQNLYSSSESYLSAKNFFSGLFLGCNKNMYHDRETMTNTYTRSSCSTALEIDGELRSDIIKLSKRMKASVFSIFAYAYSKIILDMNNNQSSVLGSVFNCRPSKYENVIGPFVTSYPLKVVPYNSDEDAIKYINELVLTINDNPMYMPLNMVEDVSLFNDLPSDTYFSDYYIMMNNYMHEELDTDLDVEVLECLEPIENKEFKSLECNKLEEVASLFLVIDEYKERYRLNLWYHIDTFSKEKAYDILSEVIRNIKELTN